MQIIPVIDLFNNVVVHAKRGQRQHYQPIQSLLTTSSAPLDIVTALLELYPFQTLYIADLDAICDTGNNDSAIEVISQAYPNLTIWLDCGIGQLNARALYIGGNIRPVLGSENIKNLQDYRTISYACQSRHVLSLDYSTGHNLSHDLNIGAMGIAELHESAIFWPDDTICMTLNAVGSEQGTDMERLNEIMRLNAVRKTQSRIYAAGGVRHTQDLQALARMGITGALIATALHNGTFSATDLLILHQLVHYSN